MKKKIFWQYFLVAPMFISLITTSCAPQKNDAQAPGTSIQDQLNTEKVRVDALPLKLAKEEYTQEEINGITTTNLLSKLNGWIEMDGFIYSVIDLNKNTSQTISFKIQISKENNSIQSNHFSLTYQLNNSNPPIPTPPPINPPDPNIPKGWSKYVTDDYKLASQIDPTTAKGLHFNHPNYNSDKTKVTLRAEGTPSHNIPGPGVPSSPNQFAQENVLTTEKHIQLTKQVFSISFHNGTEQSGTAWILDYKLTDDGSYPLTWYFGTNAHVLDDLKVADDVLYPEKFGKYSDQLKRYRTTNTDGLSIWRMDNPQVGKEYEDNRDGHTWKVTKLNFYKEGLGYNDKGYYLDKTPIKTIFSGNDFLTTSPSDFSTNSYANKEEYADFGVFEINFENETQARTATNNYAEWKEEDKFKYRRADLVNNPEFQTDKVYVVGYPQSDYGNGYRRVASNVNKTEYSDNRNNGNGLSKSVHYNTWSNRYGMYDGNIAMPWFGYSYDWIDNNSNDPNQIMQSTNYATYGLIYGTNSGNMAGGSSGALVVDEDGYAIGIHFGSDNNAATGSAQAFFSGGFNYQGYYGNYNLPQYDLIRGGFPLQKNSYFDGLVKMYGSNPNFKTRLFPNGLTSRI